VKERNSGSPDVFDGTRSRCRKCSAPESRKASEATKKDIQEVVANIESALAEAALVNERALYKVHPEPARLDRRPFAGLSVHGWGDLYETSPITRICRSGRRTQRFLDLLRIDASQLPPHRHRRAADLLELADPPGGRPGIDPFGSGLTVTPVAIRLQAVAVDVFRDVLGGVTGGGSA
jgi:hypothetical protein